MTSYVVEFTGIGGELFTLTGSDGTASIFETREAAQAVADKCASFYLSQPAERDTVSAVSRKHYIDTGLYLAYGASDVTASDSVESVAS